MFEKAIEDAVVGIAMDAAMQEMGPYIVVGGLTLMMTICYRTCNWVDGVIERRVHGNK